jgi:hypothetical protein
MFVEEFEWVSNNGVFILYEIVPNKSFFEGIKEILHVCVIYEKF